MLNNWNLISLANQLACYNKNKSIYNGYYKKKCLIFKHQILCKNIFLGFTVNQTSELYKQHECTKNFFQSFQNIITIFTGGQLSISFQYPLGNLVLCHKKTPKTNKSI